LLDSELQIQKRRTLPDTVRQIAPAIHRAPLIHINALFNLTDLIRGAFNAAIESSNYKKKSGADTHAHTS
jgi:hypothetical protein